MRYRAILALALVSHLALTSQAQTLAVDVNSIPNTSTPGSSPGAFVATSAAVYFAATTLADGEELYRSDGTAAGTQLLNLYPGVRSREPRYVVEVPSGLVMLSAEGAGIGRELWVTDGTPAGTFAIDVEPGPEGSFPEHLTVFGKYVYFYAQVDPYGSELWRSDGTAEGTELFIDLTPGPENSTSNSRDMGVAGGVLYFVANTLVQGNELWASDGTASGTAMLRQFFASSPELFTDVGGRLFFV